jgi:ribosomal protein S14
MILPSVASATRVRTTEQRIGWLKMKIAMCRTVVRSQAHLPGLRSRYAQCAFFEVDEEGMKWQHLATVDRQ